ncbi:MAG: hypothetical protein M3375_01950 [Actinomycetota bacterium]|nr:hypothetical protein [Actinomycetota bacterium]
MPAFVLAVALLAGSSSAAGAALKANGKIAFVSFRAGDPEVFTMNPDGTQQTRLTFNTGPSPDLPLLDFWPSWSSDGRKIVYTSFRGFPPNGDIFIMNPNGTGQTRVTTNPAGDLDPAFFPNGRKLVFVREVPGPNFDDPPAAQDIYTINTDGTGATNLTPGPEHETEPAVSPDGTKIAFEREVGGSGNHESGNHEIFTMNADGSGVTRLTNSPTGREQHPSFSPDGTKIVFDDNFHADPSVPGFIYRMNLDGTGVTRLTPNRTDRHGLASYSPDGTKISFTASEDIWVMNTDGSNQRPLTSHPAPDIQSNWAPAIPRAAVGPSAPPTNSCPAGTSAGVSCQPLPGGGRQITGTAGNDTIVGTNANDIIRCGDGDDVVRGGAGNDTIHCGDGRDRVNGNSGKDRIFGEAGNDRLSGDSGNDSISGGTGNDRASGGSGRDRINGNRGDDILHGNSHNDSISGSFGRDRISGNSGNDRLSGNSGNDRISGDSGRDRIWGRSGRDRLSGASGNDAISARDRQRDRVSCGRGRDRVSADVRRIDRVSRSCERVRRR